MVELLWLSTTHVFIFKPSEGNRVFDGNATDAGFSDSDGDIIGIFRDTDGSVYKSGSQIVKDLPFHFTPRCAQRTNWKMMACEDTFGQVCGLVFLQNLH